MHAHGALLNPRDIATHAREIDGDMAQVLVGLLNPDGKSLGFISGRYVDRLGNGMAHSAAPLYARLPRPGRHLPPELAPHLRGGI